MIRGDAIQLCTDITSEPLSDEILECYRRAVELNSASIEGWESIGYFLDAARDDFAAASAAFQRAIALGGSPDSFAGLARVLAQMGDREQALKMLNPSHCQFSQAGSVVKMRAEIEAGLWNP